MKSKNYSHEAFLTHAVSIDLLDYLCPVHRKEVLKVDAFRNLLNLTCKQVTGPMKKEGKHLDVVAGQIVTSVSELARLWDWHRDKVRFFLEDLEKRNVLTMDKYDKFVVISFPDLAERIAPFVSGGGNELSADSSSSHEESSEEKEPEKKVEQAGNYGKRAGEADYRYCQEGSRCKVWSEPGTSIQHKLLQSAEGSSQGSDYQW